MFYACKNFYTGQLFDIGQISIYILSRLSSSVTANLTSVYFTCNILRTYYEGKCNFGRISHKFNLNFLYSTMKETSCQRTLQMGPNVGKVPSTSRYSIFFEIFLKFNIWISWWVLLCITEKYLLRSRSSYTPIELYLSIFGNFFYFHPDF